MTQSVRAIVALNLHNYGSGRHPWGNLKPEYLEKVCIYLLVGFETFFPSFYLLEKVGINQSTELQVHLLCFPSIIITLLLYSLKYVYAIYWVLFFIFYFINYFQICLIICSNFTNPYSIWFLPVTTAHFTVYTCGRGS